MSGDSVVLVGLPVVVNIGGRNYNNFYYNLALFQTQKLFVVSCNTNLVAVFSKQRLNSVLEFSLISVADCIRVCKKAIPTNVDNHLVVVICNYPNRKTAYILRNWYH